MKITHILTLGLLLLVGCQAPPGTTPTLPDWTLGPFEKVDASNPVLEPLSSTTFFCPVRKDTVYWESKDVFNPAAVVRDGQIYLIYRAEDTVGKHAGTSRIGLATSSDGLHFERQPTPVFYPDEDDMKQYEWEGGVEDPRVVGTADGRYIMTYTSYDGEIARLCVASSSDLQTWQKHGLAFGEVQGGRYEDLWSKSGAIVSRMEGGSPVAHQVNGKYWMYWGDTDMFIATSDDLIDWEPVTDAQGELLAAFGPRDGYFDSNLVEPGPPPMITEDGILLLYNSRNYGEEMDPNLPEGTYAAGQVLIDPEDPTTVLDRTETYFIRPDKAYEIEGQVNHVCFIEGLVHYEGAWFLYYGTADSKIAVARSMSP